MNVEEKARVVAFELHKNQFRIGGAPYITHLAGVVSILKNIGIDDKKILAAAWLHDVIEDCGVTKYFLEREFNSEVTRIVVALTRDVDRKAYNERISNSDFAVKIIKLADVVHNCSDIFRCPVKMVKNKLRDCEDVYFGIAKEISEPLYEMLKHYLNEREKS